MVKLHTKHLNKLLLPLRCMLRFYGEFVSEFGFRECAPPSSTNDVPKKRSNYEVLLKNSWGLMLSSIMARGTLLSNHLPGSNLSNIKG